MRWILLLQGCFGALNCLAFGLGDDSPPRFEVFSSAADAAPVQPSVRLVTQSTAGPTNTSETDASVLEAMGEHWSRRMRARPGDAFDCQITLRMHLVTMIRKGYSAQKAIFCSCKHSSEVPASSRPEATVHWHPTRLASIGVRRDAQALAADRGSPIVARVGLPVCKVRDFVGWKSGVASALGPSRNKRRFHHRCSFRFDWCFERTAAAPSKDFLFCADIVELLEVRRAY